MIYWDKNIEMVMLNNISFSSKIIVGSWFHKKKISYIGNIIV